jgi:hypothetical protein
MAAQTCFFLSLACFIVGAVDKEDECGFVGGGLDSCECEYEGGEIGHVCGNDDAGIVMGRKRGNHGVLNSGVVIDVHLPTHRLLCAMCRFMSGA